MSEISKPKVDIASLPESLIEGFRCIECKKYLRPPIWIVCESGHNVCRPCKNKFSSRERCPGSDISCNRLLKGTVRNIVLDRMIKDLDLPMACKYHDAECDFSGNHASVIEHEEDCPFRPMDCPAFWCREKIRFHLIENHMDKEHKKISNGEWDIAHARQGYTKGYAVKSWRYSGIRFFATLMTDTNNWHLCVMAACGRKEADMLRVEIRLSSNIVPECNDVFYRPVLHYENPIRWKHDTSFYTAYTSCLHIPATVVWKHIKEATFGQELREQDMKLKEGTAIPLAIKIFEKVFLTVDKADIDEKDESDQDMEDGK